MPSWSRLRRENRVQAIEIEIPKQTSLRSTGQSNTLDDLFGGGASRRSVGRGCRRRIKQIPALGLIRDLRRNPDRGGFQ